MATESVKLHARRMWHAR